MVALVRAGRTPEKLAKEFEPSVQAIHSRFGSVDRDEDCRQEGLSTVEHKELVGLRRPGGGVIHHSDQGCHLSLR